MNARPDSVSRLCRRSAFTLIELLTVIAIIGILAAILIPTVGRVRSKARTAQCVSNLRQIGMAALLYADDHKGLLPVHGKSPLTPASEKDWTWNRKVSSYMGMDQTTARSRYICPTAKTPDADNKTTYNVSFFLDKSPLKGRVSNLTSHIVMFADAPVENSDGIWPWNYSGYDHAKRLQMFRHNGNTRQNAVFTDASVRTMSGTEGGAFRGDGNTPPNKWAIAGMGYVNNGYDTNPASPQDFIP